MAKIEARIETEKTGRIDSVRPPADLPEGTPYERMTELMRRLLRVSKDEAIPPKKRARR